jgi:hypothetical protein
MQGVELKRTTTKPNEAKRTAANTNEAKRTPNERQRTQTKRKGTDLQH